MVRNLSSKPDHSSGLGGPLEQSPTRPAEKSTVDVYSIFDREDRDDDRKLHRALAFAIAFHAGLLWVTLPALETEAIDHEKKERQVFVIQQPRFQKPVVRQREIPKERKLRVPMPDPTPDEIEPMMVDDVPEVDLPIEDGWDDLPLPDAPPEPEAPQILRVHVDVQAPERVHYVAPQYTEIARRVRLEGMVVLEAIIDRQGRVDQVRILKGLGFGLSEEAEKAVRQWRFVPSTMDGKPVAVVYNLTVHYKLN